MSTIIMVRHADKQYKNGKNDQYSLDPDITEEGKLQAYEKFSKLLSNYWIPDKIIASPYLRTRSTAAIAQSVIYETSGITIEIEYDNNLGEFLGHQIGKNLDECLRPETLQYNPIHQETQKEYNNRMSKLNNNITYNMNKNMNVLMISHGYNIQTISLFRKQKITYPKELCGLVILPNGNISAV